MDLTLRDYLNLADNTQNLLDKSGILLSNATLEQQVVNLHKGIKNIQVIAKYMADVANIANQFLLSKKKKGPSQTINPYPNSTDHSVLRTSFPEEKKELVPSIFLPVKQVDKPEQIPISKIYYIKSTKQYAINIEGIIIKGNLANITNYQSESTARCEYGIRCKNFSKGNPCKYYHEPEDYITLNKEIPDDLTRNFTVGSWLYSSTKRPKTYFARHVGSKDTLKQDLQYLKKAQYLEEVANREGQLVHDLLIYCLLHNQGMLEKYPSWLE